MSASSAVLLPHVPSSVAVAREHVRAELRSLGVSGTAVEDTALVVSELLSNALRHARPLPSGLIRVAWRARDNQVEVAVSDGGSATEPTPRTPALTTLGGRGLGIVDFLSEAWGVRHEHGTTTVWAVLRAPHLAGAFR